MNLRDSLLPATPTKLTLGDVDAKSLYALNSISRVQLERERHGAFSLNDLVLELSHFLDEEVVNKVETEMFPVPEVVWIQAWLLPTGRQFLLL